MRGAYECIEDFLRRQKKPRVCMKFSEIEKVCRKKLPASARKHRPWWANSPNRSLVKWVLAASWRVDGVGMKNETVWFRRSNQNESSQTASTTRAKTSSVLRKESDCEGMSAPDCKHKVCVATACGGKKNGGLLPAWQQYRSPRIRAVRNRRCGRDMYILSAKHGLLPSEKKIEPYDRIMDEQRCKELQPGMVNTLKKYDKVIYFKAGASKIYAKCMREACERAGIPLESFGFGFMGGIGELSEQIRKACES